MPLELPRIQPSSTLCLQNTCSSVLQLFCLQQQLISWFYAWLGKHSKVLFCEKLCQLSLSPGNWSTMLPVTPLPHYGLLLYSPAILLPHNLYSIMSRGPTAAKLITLYMPPIWMNKEVWVGFYASKGWVECASIHARAGGPIFICSPPSHFSCSWRSLRRCLGNLGAFWRRKKVEESNNILIKVRT